MDRPFRAEKEGGKPLTCVNDSSQRELLCRAAAWQEKQPGQPWTWPDVAGEPEDIVGLMVRGCVEIVGEQNPRGRLLYLLTPAGREQAKS